MTDKQNQHFVPQYYFRNFSTDEKSIRMLVKSSGKIVLNAPIGTQASRNKFYGSREIEKKVTEFDNKYSAVFSKVISHVNDKELTHHSFMGMMESLCFQELRTLNERKSKAPLMDFFEGFFQPQLDANDDYDSGGPPEVTKVINDAMRTALETMSDPKSWQTYHMFNVEGELAEILDLDAVFLKNVSGTTFIFSDTPVARFNFALKDQPYDKHGNKHFGLTLHYPINSELGFLMFDRNAYELISDDQNIVTVSDRKDVDALNILQIHNAVNSIYFRDVECGEYVNNLWESEKDRFMKDIPKVECLEEITLDGYLTGRMVNTLVLPEPTFVPELTFLKVVDFSGYHFLPYRERFVSVLENT
ncbi:DUF4238 domain-containing protein [Vreelandella titanicae]|uniref:DUF4238 domain-containing protein n=1 Tax=Vreelandella titanicae TaxID=664683 RepID=UPI0039BF3005